MGETMHMIMMNQVELNNTRLEAAKRAGDKVAQWAARLGKALGRGMEHGVKKKRTVAGIVAATGAVITVIMAAVRRKKR